MWRRIVRGWTPEYSAASLIEAMRRFGRPGFTAILHRENESRATRHLSEVIRVARLTLRAPLAQRPLRGFIAIPLPDDPLGLAPLANRILGNAALAF
jgi:hypothetical protein